MGILIVIISIAAIALEILIIVKFFELCADVRKLELGVSAYAATDSIDVESVRLAIILGKQDEMYNKIVGKAYGLMRERMKYTSAATLYDSDAVNNLDKKIAFARKLLAMMNFEMPHEMQNEENFKSFISETTV